MEYKGGGAVYWMHAIKSSTFLCSNLSKSSIIVDFYDFPYQAHRIWSKNVAINVLAL